MPKIAIEMMNDNSGLSLDLYNLPHNGMLKMRWTVQYQDLICTPLKVCVDVNIDKYYALFIS